MRNSLYLFVFVLFFCLFPSRLNAEGGLLFPDLEATISMDFQDASLKNILKIFSIQSGLNFIASEAVQDRKITLYLDKVPIKEAMDKLFKANNLTYELDEDANIFIVKDWGKPKPETITQVFYLKYASVSSSSLKQERSAAGAGGLAQDSGITKVVEKLLSEYGSIIEDSRTNSLIVTDIPSRIPIITQIIASLDVAQPQVMLEVEMLDVSKNTVDKLGFEFGDNPFTLILPGGLRGSKLFMGDVTRRGKTDVDSTSAGSIVFGRTYAELLDFLRTQTDTKYLARPRILTLNNETAEIKITTQEAVGETTTISGQVGITTSAAQAERYETGVSLKVTPQISLETGEITMFIVPTVAEASVSGIKSSLGVPFFNPEERSTKSVVRIKDGETVILGGLIRNELQQTITKLPILGDIPILGALFRHKNKTRDRDRELLVFITPHIVKDTAVPFPPAKRVMFPEREQSVISGIDRQLSINTYLNTFERK